VPATPAAPPVVVRPPEPAKAVNPAPKTVSGDQKPRVVEEKKDDTRGEKKDEKPDKEDEEKKRK